MCSDMRVRILYLTSRENYGFVNSLSRRMRYDLPLRAKYSIRHRMNELDGCMKRISGIVLAFDQTQVFTEEELYFQFLEAASTIPVIGLVRNGEPLFYNNNGVDRLIHVTRKRKIRDVAHELDKHLSQLTLDTLVRRWGLQAP